MKPKLVKPIEKKIYSVQVTAENMEAVAKWCSGKVEAPSTYSYRKPWIYLEGVRSRKRCADETDWVVKIGSDFLFMTDSDYRKEYVV